MPTQRRRFGLMGNGRFGSGVPTGTPDLSQPTDRSNIDHRGRAGYWLSDEQRRAHGEGLYDWPDRDFGWPNDPNQPDQPPPPQTQQEVQERRARGLLSMSGGGGVYGAAGGAGQAAQRTVQGNELVSNQLTELLNEGSPYMQQARAAGLAHAASRGLLNSTAAGRASQRAAIEAGLPIATQDASTYGRTASENMQAKNNQMIASEGNAAQLGAAAMGADASRYGSTLDYNASMMNLDATEAENEARRRFEAGEANLNRNWQDTGEARRRGWGIEDQDRARDWTVEDRDFAAGENRYGIARNEAMEQQRMAIAGREQYFAFLRSREEIDAQNISAIMSNPNLNAREAAAARDAYMRQSQQSWQRYTQLLSSPLPPIFAFNTPYPVWEPPTNTPPGP